MFTEIEASSTKSNSEHINGNTVSSVNDLIMYKNKYIETVPALSLL